MTSLFPDLAIPKSALMPPSSFSIMCKLSIMQQKFLHQFTRISSIWSMISGSNETLGEKSGIQFVIRWKRIWFSMSCLTCTRILECKERGHGHYKTTFSLPFPHKFASAPATILRVCGSSVLNAVLASNCPPPLLIINPWFSSAWRFKVLKLLATLMSSLWNDSFIC